MPLPKRKFPRLQDYDYSWTGGYFVTICTYKKEYLFGDINDEEMHLSDIGQLAKTRWLMIPEFFPTVKLNDYVIMPNHLHGILFLTESKDKTPTLGKIIGAYKASVTRIARQTMDCTSQIWQSSYYDHIIRNESDWLRIREYIQYNVAKWDSDDYY